MGSRPVDLFTPGVPESKLNEKFKTIATAPGSAPARHLLQQFFSLLPRPDGNFIRDFQTTGFDARIWELFLFAFGVKTGFKVDRSFDRPDFLFSADCNGKQAWIEAVTSNPTVGEHGESII